MKPTTKAPTVSVIIPVHNGEKQLGACLDSIFGCKNIEFEVIVVDDGSTDQSRSIAERYPCRLIVLNENKGPAFARNRAIEISQGGCLLFTDHDCIVGDDWVAITHKEFLRVQRNDPLVAGAEGRVLPMKGLFNKCDAYASYGVNQNLTPRYTDDVCTSNVMLDKKKVLSVHMFDEHIPTLEDKDLGIRLLANGYRLCYIPQSSVVHNHMRRGLTGYLSHEYMWGKRIGNYFELRYSHFHSTPINRWLGNCLIYLITTPMFALGITAKIILRNVLYDGQVLMLAPLIFLSKMAYRIGALQCIWERQHLHGRRLCKS